MAQGKHIRVEAENAVKNPFAAAKKARKVYNSLPDANRKKA